jgi:hypothetical protein
LRITAVGPAARRRHLAGGFARASNTFGNALRAARERAHFDLFFR